MNSEDIHHHPDPPQGQTWPPGSHPFAKAWGYDRARVLIDRPMLPGPVKQLRRACSGGLEVVPGRVKFNPVWQCTVDMYQPSLLALQILNDLCLGSQVGALLTYVEITHDLMFRRRAAALRYESQLLQRLIMRHQRGHVVRHSETTNYFNGRSDASAGKRGRVGVVYSDRPSKLNTPYAGRPCVHIECRITGSAKLAAIGLASVGDLQEFDFGLFWNSAAALYALPPKTEIGQIIGGPGGDDVSGTALRKRGQKFIQECSIGDQFFMHNAVRREPRLLRRLEKLPMDFLYSPAAVTKASSD